MTAPVQRDQFKIWSKGITHEPTGATYTPHPGAPHSGIMNLNQLGNLLPNGDDYRPPRSANDDGSVVGRVRQRESPSVRRS
jgi:hypothetical protein